MEFLKGFLVVFLLEICVALNFLLFWLIGKIVFRNK